MKYDYFNSDEDDEDENIFNPHAQDEVNGIEGIVKAINGMLNDKLLPKSVILKLTNCIQILKNETEELPLKINKIHDILNEITEDSNLPSFVKTQIWTIAGMLERI